MLKLCTLLACILFIVFAGSSSHAAPLDSPGTVYIDGLPCNRACQSYMAWSRGVLSQQSPAVVPQPAPSQIARPPSKAKVQRATRIRESTPGKAAPSRVAKKAAPTRIEAPPTGTADPQFANRQEGKPAPGDTSDSPPALNPPPAVEAAETRQPVTTSPAEADSTTTTASLAPEENANSKPDPSDPLATNPAAQADTSALAPPNNVDQLVAIVLARPEIKSVSDLANRVVAIDDSPSDYSVAGVESGMVAAGAAQVQISEDKKRALIRVIDGDVQAAVVTVLPREAAEAWNADVQGFNVLRVPLTPPSEKARRG